MQMVAHYRVGINAAGENCAQFQNALLDPGLAVLETCLRKFIFAAQPGAAHAAIDAVVGAGLRWVYELAAGLGHCAILTVSVAREPQLRTYIRVG